MTHLQDQIDRDIERQQPERQPTLNEDRYERLLRLAWVEFANDYADEIEALLSKEVNRSLLLSTWKNRKDSVRESCME